MRGGRTSTSEREMGDCLAVTTTAETTSVCEQHTCGRACAQESGCGWTSGFCVAGGRTSTAELSMGPGCPTTSEPTTSAPSTTGPTTPSPTSAVSTICGHMVFHSDAELAAALPVTRACVFLNGGLRIGAARGTTVGGVTNTTLLAEAFPNLQAVRHDLFIIEAPELASIDGAFPNLQTVHGALVIRTNPLLTSIGSSFGSLQTVNGNLMWNANGGQALSAPSTPGSRAFCASAHALCATTTSWGPPNSFAESNSDAFSCCTAYCATATDC